MIEVGVRNIDVDLPYGVQLGDVEAGKEPSAGRNAGDSTYGKSDASVTANI